MLIPCMLFTKVAATLAESHHWTLFAIPTIAVIQAGAVTAYLAPSSCAQHERQLERAAANAFVEPEFVLNAQILVGWLASHVAVRLVDGQYCSLKKVTAVLRCRRVYKQRSGRSLHSLLQLRSELIDQAATHI